MNDSISVIIPVWNRSQMLVRAIKSVLSQSVHPQEIIVVDDGSTDNIAEVIHEMECLCNQKEVFFKYMRIAHSGMPGQVRNHGIKNAKSEWVAFLDSDDEWFPHKLEKQIEEIKKSKTLWCHTRERWERNGIVKSQKSQSHKRKGNIFDDALVKCIVGPSTVLMHSTLFETCGYFSENLEIAEDYELWLRVCYKYDIGYVDEPCIIKYAGHENQLSEKYGYVEIFRIQALASLLDDYRMYYNSSSYAKLENAFEYKKRIWELGRIKYENRETFQHNCS